MAFTSSARRSVTRAQRPWGPYHDKGGGRDEAGGNHKRENMKQGEIGDNDCQRDTHIAREEEVTLHALDDLYEYFLNNDFLLMRQAR